MLLSISYKNGNDWVACTDAFSVFVWKHNSVTFLPVFPSKTIENVDENWNFRKWFSNRKILNLIENASCQNGWKCVVVYGWAQIDTWQRWHRFRSFFRSFFLCGWQAKTYRKTHFTDKGQVLQKSFCGRKYFATPWPNENVRAAN